MGFLDRLRRRSAQRESSPEVLRAGDPQYQTRKEATRAAEKERQLRQREERLAAGGSTAAKERRGLVRGKHYTEWSHTVRDLKREGRYDDALALLEECIAAAERDRDGREPAPWYTDQAAIIYRKRKEYSREVAVLERYVSVCPAWMEETRIHVRLAKARGLAARYAGGAAGAARTDEQGDKQ